MLPDKAAAMIQAIGLAARQHQRALVGGAVAIVIVIVLAGGSGPPPSGTLTESPSSTQSSSFTPGANGTPNSTASTGETAEWQPNLPIRAAFYYPWFPEAWSQQGLDPFTRYHPSVGFYDSSSGSVVRSHIGAMQYGNVAAGIASWWGQGSQTDVRLPSLLAAAASTHFRWAAYYEPEGQTDPSVQTIHDDLVYLAHRYGSDPAYLRVGGRFVVFVYADPADSCAMADRWVQANTVHAYVVLKVFSGYRSCQRQPDSWHQYAPAGSDAEQAGYSYSISPGFNKATESGPRLTRDLARWGKSISDMTASGEPWQLITTFNEWGEGTSVESAAEWQTASGYGAYLDALHSDGTTGPQATPAPTLQPMPVPAGAAVLVGAGDIASCTSHGDEQTAALLGSIPGTVIALGDNAYEEGSLQQYLDCYDGAWGRYKARTRPAVGNHEYLTSGAQGFRDYFGWGAAPTYYAYNAGAWRVYVMDSNCSQVGGCGPGSPQYQWLSSDLIANPRTCVLAYWHHPKFTLGPQANDESGAGAFWALLYAHGAELVLNGHDHSYQRWTPMRPDGTPDPNGIMEIVDGAGGANFTTPTRSDARVDAQNHDTFGVIRLVLRPGSYDWQFISVSGGTFTDAGSGSCH
jgi:hypothetical protein